MSALLPHKLRCLNCGWSGTRLVGDIRGPGDESHCPKCASETSEDKRIITLKNFSNAFLLCGLVTMFFNESTSIPLFGIALVCRWIAKKRGADFSGPYN